MTPETIQFTLVPPSRWSLEQPPLVEVEVSGIRNRHSWEVTSIYVSNLPPMTPRSWSVLLRLTRQYLKKVTGLVVYNVDREAVRS